MATPGRYPVQIKYIIGNEACERFSFYGMSSILTIYMLQQLVFTDRDAKASFHWFVTATYLTPLAGGWLADRVWGRYRTIVWISCGYVVGHVVLAVWTSQAGLLAGLALIAIGSGGIKPCVTAFVGEQFRPEQRALFERIYGWFYWVVNLGAASASLLVPWLLKRHGPAVAFAVPGLLMGLALVLFRAGARHYVRTPPAGPDPHGFLQVLGRAIRRLGTGRPGQHWLDTALDRHPAEAVEGAKAIVRILAVFAAVTLFWALFHQKSSSWVVQARSMDLTLGGVELSPAQLQALNPFLILALIPLFTWGVFPLLERRGVVLSPLEKMTAGMFITALSFVAAALVQTWVDGARPAGLAVAARPSVLWQIPQYLLLTVGEVLVSVTGLEFSYTQAPRSMRSTVMSIWFLTVALGNLLTAVVTDVVRLEGAAYFWMFAGLMLLAAFVFRALARRYLPAVPEGAGLAGAR